MHLTLNIKEILESSPLSVLLVVAWSPLWWRGRRIRLWFAGLAPLGAVVGVFLGLLAYLGERGPVRPVSCTPALCGGWEGVAPYRDATSGIGQLIIGNSLLALIVAVALGLLTLVVELLTLVVEPLLARPAHQPAPEDVGQAN